jgi:hypothetical protein
MYVVVSDAVATSQSHRVLERLISTDVFFIISTLRHLCSDENTSIQTEKEVFSCVRREYVSFGRKVRFKRTDKTQIVSSKREQTETQMKRFLSSNEQTKT